MSGLDIGERRMLKLISQGQGGCFRLLSNVARLKALGTKGYAVVEERGEDTIGRITPAGRAALASDQRGGGA